MLPCIVNRPSGTGDYLLLFCYDPVLIGVDGIPLLCPSNTLIIWEPGQRQSYGNPDLPWCHSWMHCDGQRVGEYLTASGVSLNVPLPHDPEIAERYLLAIWREVSQHISPDPTIVGNALHSWSREMHRMATTPSPAPIPLPWLDCRRFLHDHCTEIIHLDLLAERMGLSVPHFCHEFKRYFQLPAIDYLIKIRLQHAVYLLRDQNLSILEIAMRVGYQDLYHFSKLFKKHFHLSPRAMRRQLLST